MTEYSVSVCIGTFGDPIWEQRARKAAESAVAQRCAEVVHVHGETLADARNRAVEEATGEWVVTLDADDSLAPGYIDAMSHATGDLRAPRLRFVDDDGRHHEPFDLTRRDIRRTNPCAIGTAVRRADVIAVGGWREWQAYEDFDLFRRLWLAGNRIEHVSAAVYLAHRRAGSRNDVADPAGLTKAIIDSHQVAS